MVLFSHLDAFLLLEGIDHRFEVDSLDLLAIKEHCLPFFPAKLQDDVRKWDYAVLDK
jgi:hypothetical protein